MHPKTIHGLRAPLFDRLVDSAPEARKELMPLRVHDRDALFSSIARDLQRLLNARSATDAPLDPARATVLDYGIPDFSQLSAASVTDRRHLAETLRAAISAFEPRLQEIFIRIEDSGNSPNQILGSISCKVRLGKMLEPITFPILLHSGEHSVEVLAPEDRLTSDSLSIASAPEPSHG
jgi:type VI secretion system lysozyme-like protein